MNNYSELKRLSDVFDIIIGGTPKTDNEKYWNGDIPWLSVRDFVGDRKHVYSTEKYITKEGLDNSASKILLPGDIIISARGTVGEIAQIALPMAFNQSSYGLHAKEGYFQDYLYYALMYHINYLKKVSNGAVFDTIVVRTFYHIKILIPDINTQKKIASILSTYDDLIEKNNQKIKVLQEIAEEIYKEWFVRFRFPGHEKTKIVNGLPEGWKLCMAKDNFDISIGKTPPRNESQWFSKDNLNVMWTSISDLRNSNVYILDTSEYLTHEAITKFNVPIIPENTVLLSFKLTIGQVAITTKQMTSNEAIAQFKTNDKEILEYIYHALKNYSYERLGNTSSIGNAINSQIVKKMKLIMPSRGIIIQFHELINPIMNLIKSRSIENIKLSKQRDLLLPRLMSGKLTVKAEK